LLVLLLLLLVLLVAVVCVAAGRSCASSFFHHFFSTFIFLIFFSAGVCGFFGRQWQSAIATRTGKASKRQLQIIMPKRAAPATTATATTTIEPTTTIASCHSHVNFVCCWPKLRLTSRLKLRQRFLLFSFFFAFCRKSQHESCAQAQLRKKQNSE